VKRVAGDDTTEVAAKLVLKTLHWFSDVAAALSSGQKPLKYAIVNGVQASKTMAELDPVGQAWMAHWLEQLTVCCKPHSI
jgi:urease accessory protein UreF